MKGAEQLVMFGLPGKDTRSRGNDNLLRNGEGIMTASVTEQQYDANDGRLLAGKIAIVTGAGKGIGRAEAIELAAQGAKVVVNDNGSAIGGERTDLSVADAVVSQIHQSGGTAVANYDDISSWEGARRRVETAVKTFGALDVLVNNAGNYRPKPILDITEEDWDAVIRVHLKGHFAMTHHAAHYWRQESEAGRQRRASIINTVSRGALPPHSRTSAHYSTAKAGIAALTVVSQMQLEHIGVRVNAISPSAFTRMIAKALTGDNEVADQAYDTFDPRDPANNAPLVAWLASDDSLAVGGQVLRVHGNTLQLLLPWHDGPMAQTQGRWRVEDMPEAVYGQIFGIRPAGSDLLGTVSRSFAKPESA